MHSLSRLTGFIATGLLGINLCVYAQPQPPIPSSCYTGVAATNEDADDFYLGGEVDSNKVSEEVQIEADSAEFSEDGVLQLDGNVLIEQSGYRARSTRAKVDQNNGRAWLEGGVSLDAPNLAIEGRSAQVNLSENQARFEDAKFLNPQTRLRGEAKIIRQENQDLVVLEQGLFTTCTPDDKAWAIRASEIILGQERGYGEAYHTRFEVLDVPILYVPYFRFPIDDRRKSGFLYPTFGSSNTGEGAFFSTPYYFNIAPEVDATFTPTYIGGRGLHPELEVRYLNRFSETTLGFGYLQKDESYLQAQRLLGFEQEDGKRWGLSLEQEYDFAAWSPAWHGDLDFSEVSDNDYLDDLNQGLRIANKDHLDRRAQVFTRQIAGSLGYKFRSIKTWMTRCFQKKKHMHACRSLITKRFFIKEALSLIGKVSWYIFIGTLMSKRAMQLLMAPGFDMRPSSRCPLPPVGGM